MKRLATIGFLLTLFSVKAATYYVNSATGNDAADGSLATPWLTIHNAFTNLTAGDTLNCTGTFAENAGAGSHYDLTNTGTAGNPITLQAYGAGATIDMVCGGDWCNYNFTGNYLTFDGFKMTTSAPGSSVGAFSFFGTVTPGQGGGTRNIVKNCEIYNVSSALTGGDKVWCFQTGVASSLCTFTNLYFHDITDADLFRIWGTYHTITHCVISNCINPNTVQVHADLIQCGGDTSLSNVFECNLVINNAITNGMSGGDIDCRWSGGACAADATDWVYRNNVFSTFGTQSIQDYCARFHFYNNVFYNFDPKCISFSADSTNATLINNVFISSGLSWPWGYPGYTNNYNAWDAQSITNTYAADFGSVYFPQGYGPSNLITTAAACGFVNAAGGDFHLTSWSPLRGRGANLTSDTSASTTDKDGRARPAVGGWDIGPYQSDNAFILQINGGVINKGSFGL